MIRTRLLPLLAGGAIAAAAAFVLWGPSRQYRRAKAAVARDMRDPESVQFRDLTRGFDQRVCGELNGKNAMGAYVGFRKFVWSEREGVYLASDDERGNAKFWADLCTPAGDRRQQALTAAELSDSLYIARLSPHEQQAFYARQLERLSEALGASPP